MSILCAVLFGALGGIAGLLLVRFIFWLSSAPPLLYSNQKPKPTTPKPDIRSGAAFKEKTNEQA